MGSETSEFVRRTQFLFGLSFIQCYLQRMRLYSVFFYFYHNKGVIFNSFPVTMIFFKLNQSPTFLLINLSVQHLHWSDVCTSPTFVLSDFCTVRPLHCPTFVPSDVCTYSYSLVPIYNINILYMYISNYAIT